MLEKILNNNLEELLKALAATGKFEYEKDGLKIVASADKNNTSITCTYANPVEDKAKDLKIKFEKYISTLSDEFFAEICDAYKTESLERVQAYVNSNEPAEVLMGIQDFMAKTKMVAKHKIAAIDEEMLKLNTIRDTYVHVLNQNF